MKFFHQAEVSSIGIIFSVVCQYIKKLKLKKSLLIIVFITWTRLSLAEPKQPEMRPKDVAKEDCRLG